MLKHQVQCTHISELLYFIIFEYFLTKWVLFSEIQNEPCSLCCHKFHVDTNVYAGKPLTLIYCAVNKLLRDCFSFVFQCCYSTL